jgi:WD40 repeat protein
VSASDDSTLKVWDVASGSLVKTLVGHTSFVTCVDVSPDNAQILSGSLDETWSLWNSRTGELQHTQEMNEYISCCLYSPDGRLLLVGCGSNLILHDSVTYQLQHTFAGHVDIINCCSCAPDGATVLSGSSDRTLKLWSTTTGQCLRTLYGHSEDVHSCFFSPSGHEICSASYDGTMAMWAMDTGQTRGVLDTDSTAPGSRSRCACSSGKCIVSGHVDGTVKMWGVPRGWGAL